MPWTEVRGPHTESMFSKIRNLKASETCMFEIEEKLGSIESSNTGTSQLCKVTTKQNPWKIWFFRSQTCMFLKLPSFRRLRTCGSVKITYLSSFTLYCSVLYSVQWIIPRFAQIEKWHLGAVLFFCLKTKTLSGLFYICPEFKILKWRVLI